MAVPAFKAVWGAIVLSPVGSIPTPSAKNLVAVSEIHLAPHQYRLPATGRKTRPEADLSLLGSEDKGVMT